MGQIDLRRLRLLRELEERGGFELWRSPDGSRWEPVTRNGFGSPSSFGVETMLSTPAGLFVGTVSLPPVHAGVFDEPLWPTGCEVWHGA